MDMLVRHNGLGSEWSAKKTPGVDQEIWDTPEKRTQAVHALNRRGSNRVLKH